MEMFNLWFNTVLLPYFKTLPKDDTKLIIGRVPVPVHKKQKNLTLFSTSIPKVDLTF